MFTCIISLYYYIAPSAVTDLLAINTTDSSFTISWNRPGTPNGIIINYIVNIVQYTGEPVLPDTTVIGQSTVVSQGLC